MAKVSVDVAFDEDTQTLEGVLDRIKKTYRVSAKLVGEYNGWPEIDFEGERLDLARMLRQEFGDDDGFLASFIK